MANKVVNLKIIEVKNKGIKGKEYLAIDVIHKCNLLDYMVYDNSYYSDGSLSNEHRHIYRFPDKIVTEKDLVILYTHEGQREPEKNNVGGLNYFYFMNLKNETIWNKGKDVAHLILINEEQDLNV